MIAPSIIRAFADDLGIILYNFYGEFKGVFEAYGLLGRCIGLIIKIGKCAIICIWHH